MSKGQRYPSENREHKDAASGRRIRQITSHPSIHHHPFFFVRAYDDAMQKLVFVSYRTGKPQIFFEDRASGELVQATDRPDLADWSIIPSADGRYVYFTAGTAGWRVNLDTFRGRATRRFRRRRDAREGHGRRRDGHDGAVEQRPLVGGAGQIRAGDALRADRHGAEDLARVPGARHHRPSAVLPGRRRSHSLCRPADRPGLAHRPRAATRTAGSTSAKTRCSG